MRWVWLWFLATPAWANLFFYFPYSAPMKPGEIRIDFGAAHGRYLVQARHEDRTYLPDLRLHAQLYPRLALSIEFFGVNRSESHYEPHPEIELRDREFGPGDISMATWFDLVRGGPKRPGIKAFFQTKWPNASEEKMLGTDVTDLFLGLTGDWRSERLSLSGLARLDVVGRGMNDQWDYFTIAAQPELRVSRRWSILADLWHRYRSTNTTSLFSLGCRLELRPNWTLEALAGKGDYDRFEANPDSRLKSQYSLRLKWRLQSPRLKKWLGN